MRERGREGGGGCGWDKLIGHECFLSGFIDHPLLCAAMLVQHRPAIAWVHFFFFFFFFFFFCIHKFIHQSSSRPSHRSVHLSFFDRIPTCWPVDGVLPTMMCRHIASSILMALDTQDITVRLIRASGSSLD